MENELGKPSAAYLRELREVAKAAAALSSHLVTANILPRDFPIEPVTTLCAALTLLPHGTSEGSVPVLLHARERVPALRREYVLSEPEEGVAREHHDIPPVFRGEELDRRLNELYAAVGTALDHYKAETSTEIEPDAERDAPVPALPEFGLKETVKDISKAEAEVGGIKAKLPADTAGQRGLSDIDSQLKAGRSEASMPAPKPALLTRIGKALTQTPEAFEKIGYWMSAVDDLSEPLIDAGFEILRKKVTGLLGRISKVGVALQETGRRMKKWRDGAPGIRSSAPADVDLAEVLDVGGIESSESHGGLTGFPPPDFNMSEVHAMILRGETPPAAWRSFIRELDFGGVRELGDLSPVSSLSALTGLNINGTQVNDVWPLSGLRALTHLNLNETLVGDLLPLAGLRSLTHLYLETRHVVDFSPLAGLSALKELDLAFSVISDLSPLSGMRALTGLYLHMTGVSDLSPVSSLSELTGLYLGHTQVSDLSPLSGLSALKDLNLQNTLVTDLSPLSGLSGLTGLYLWETQVSDLRPISGLHALATLAIMNTQVTDLSPLSDLHALRVLTLSDNMHVDVSVLNHLEHLTINGGPAPRQGKP